MTIIDNIIKNIALPGGMKVV